MSGVLYWLARGPIGLVQALPLRWVMALGRAGGQLAFWIDRRHRQVALDNVRLCFGRERSEPELQALVGENFRRLGENYASAVRTAVMSDAEIRQHLEVQGVEWLSRTGPDADRSRVIAIGHFGNFELYARVNLFVPGYQCATTYRALPQPRLNQLLQGLRSRSGCLYFERRTEVGALRGAMRRQRLMIGFLADQHAGDRGLRLPFFGLDCSTSTAPAVFALRYACPLHVAICYRVAPAKWRIEIAEPIPTHHGQTARSVEEITQDINRAFEVAVRRDPANWFWVHRRWKPGKYRGGGSAASSPRGKTAGSVPDPAGSADRALGLDEEGG